MWQCFFYFYLCSVSLWIHPNYILFSVELQKANLESQNNAPNGAGPSSSSSQAGQTPNTTNNTCTTTNPLASAIPLAQLLAKPGALNALSSLTALGGLTDLLGGGALGAGHAVHAHTNAPIQTTGVHRHKSYQPRLRSPNGGGQESKIKNERNKFNPY